MKFVSVFLVAMIAMMLVVPAFACTANYENCESDNECCDGWECKQGGLGKVCTRTFRAAKTQVRKSLLSALNMLEDNHNNVDLDGHTQVRNLDLEPHTQVRKNIMSALTMLDDN